MDLWTDPNLVSYMAVAAHWIQAKLELNESGSHYSLKMRADLIGFQRVPGSHTGEQLAEYFTYIIKHLGIWSKVLFYFLIYLYNL